MIGIGVFEFILLIVLISTIGKVLMSWSGRPKSLPGASPQDVDRLNEAVSDLHTRMTKLEEERDFYRALLESPNRASLPEPPEEGEEHD
jgi:hypothetical protein